MPNEQIAKLAVLKAQLEEQLAAVTATIATLHGQEDPAPAPAKKAPVKKA